MQEVYRTEAKPVLLLAFALNLLGNCWPRQGLCYCNPAQPAPAAVAKDRPPTGAYTFIANAMLVSDQK